MVNPLVDRIQNLEMTKIQAKVASQVSPKLLHVHLKKKPESSLISQRDLEAVLEDAVEFVLYQPEESLASWDRDAGELIPLTPARPPRPPPDGVNHHHLTKQSG